MQLVLEPGDRIADLEIGEVIGQGTNAVIFKAHSDTLGPVALKVAFGLDEVVRRRMIAEGEVLQNILHRNVVRVHRSLFVDGRPALIMEFIEGPTLASWLDVYGRPTIPDALQLFAGLCEGVWAAHEAGLIHRDLSPHNVLLAVSSGKQVVPKLVDFGLVRTVERRVPSRTATGPLGTLSYMAPEQMQNARTVDQRADLYALGCILYQLTTGRPAFHGALRAQLARAEVGAYVPPEQHRPDLPAPVGRAIRTLLEPDPDDRYASVTELMRDLYGHSPAAPRSRVVRKVSEVSTAAAAVLRSMSRPDPDASSPAPIASPAEWVALAAMGLVMVLSLVGTVVVLWH